MSNEQGRLELHKRRKCKNLKESEHMEDCDVDGSALK
jgi:hypothetical protein